MKWLSRLLERVRAIPSGMRLGMLVTLAVLVVFGTWFFFFRSGSNPVVPQPPPPRPAVGKVVSYADYSQAVESALADVRSAIASSGDDRKAAIKRAISDLDAVEGAGITASTGNTVVAEADNTTILSELQRDDPNLEAVESYLSILSTALAQDPVAVSGTTSGAQAGAVLTTILSDPIYDYTKSESPLDKLIRWISSITGTNDPNEVLARIIYALLAGLALGSLSFLVLQRWIPNRWARLSISTIFGLIVAVVFYLFTDHLDILFELLAVGGLVVAAVAAGIFVAGLNRASAPSSVRTISDLEAVLGMGAEEARRRADASAAEGDYRAAIRYRCLAVLLALDEAGMLVFDRSATNREYLFRAPGPIHDDLQSLLGRFEAIWYGNSPTGPDEWPEYNARAAAIEAYITSHKTAKAA